MFSVEANLRLLCLISNEKSAVCSASRETNQSGKTPKRLRHLEPNTPLFFMHCVVFIHCNLTVFCCCFVCPVHRNVHLGIHGAVRRSQRADLRARGVLCVLAQRGGGPHPDTDSCYHGRMDHEHLLGNGHGHPGESVLVWLCLFSLFSPVFRFCSLHLSCLCQSCLLLFCLSHT